MFKKIIYYFWLKPGFRKLWCNTVLATGFWDKALMNRKVSDSTWLQRIQDIQNCPDYALLDKVSDAGKIMYGKQYMHNGLRIYPDSYYGYAGTRLLIENKGVHEPQEELIFQDFLPCFKPGAVMLELGAYWGFYSMWFARNVKDARNYLLEPVPLNMEIGKDNFELNQLKGTFIQGYAGEKYEMSTEGIPVYDMDSLAQKLNLKHIDLLHCDIQGFEIDYLRGALSWLNEKKISVLFISTHSEQIHSDCKNLLENAGYTIVADIPLAGSYSVDGLICAASPDHPVPAHVRYHLKPLV